MKKIVFLDIENSKTKKVNTLELSVIKDDEENFIFDISSLNKDETEMLNDAINSKLLYTDIELFYIGESTIPYFGPDYEFIIENGRLIANLREQCKKFLK